MGDGNTNCLRYDIPFPNVSPARQNKLHSLSSKRVPLIPIFYSVKNQSSAPLFLLSAKSITPFSCSFVNALASLNCRYQLFAVKGACSQCLHNGERTKSFGQAFSKACGFLRQSLKSPSAEGEIS